MKTCSKSSRKVPPRGQGVTLLELLVVLFIIGILATVAVTVYTGQVERARVAACRDTIRQLELAINRYEVDTGQLPPSSSGLPIAPDTLILEKTAGGSFGCGYLQLAIIHSLSGDMYHPLHRRWLGPYIEPDEDQLGDRYGMPVTATTPKGYVQILDPWGLPYYYVRASDYADFGGTKLPTNHPFYVSETYYNPSSFQIFSTGHNGVTYAVPYRGEETDDVNNWRKYGVSSTLGGSARRSSSRRERQRSVSERRRQRNYGDTERGYRPGRYQAGETPLTARMLFTLPDNTKLAFNWPEGWQQDGNKMMPPTESGKSVWILQAMPNFSYENLLARYTQSADAKTIFTGADPTGKIPDSFVVEVMSKSCPEIDLQEVAEDNLYHLAFAFKQGDYVCWWASNFDTIDQMEAGRQLITRVVETMVAVQK